MSAANTPRSRRLAGHRPSASGRPRKVADSRRAAGRSALPATPPAARPPVATGGVATVADRPVSGTVDGKAGENAAGAARRPFGRLSVVLLAVAVLLAVLVGLLARDLLRMDRRADARQAAQVVAADSMESILSYDHAGYDKGVAAAKTLMTEDFAKEYTRTIDDVRAAVMETRSVVEAQVVASSVVSAEPDRVRTLLFVNQTTSGDQVEEPRVDLNRVVVTLVRGDDDAWLVSDIDAL